METEHIGGFQKLGRQVTALMRAMPLEWTVTELNRGGGFIAYQY